MASHRQRSAPGDNHCDSGLEELSFILALEALGLWPQGPELLRDPQCGSLGVLRGPKDPTEYIGGLAERQTEKSFHFVRACVGAV